MCIKFNVAISGNDAYICIDINNKKLFNTLEYFNKLLKGSFIITSIGFKNIFFYPLFFKRNYNSLSAFIYCQSQVKLDFFS